MADLDRVWRAKLGEFLVRLGGAMAVAGESVDHIQARLTAVGRAYGLTEVDVLVFPTMLLIETGEGESAQVHLTSASGPALRLDQVAVLYEILRDAEEEELTPAEGIERLDAVESMRARVPWALRVLGHGLASGGLSLLLQPSLEGLVASVLLGLVVGLLKLPHRPTLELVFPVASSFGIALGVLALFDHIDDPLGVLIPPLITLLPGAALTTGVVELAAGQMLSGASRLVYGGMQLLLLAFGILAAAALLDSDPGKLVSTAPSDFAWWGPWLGVLVLAAGFFLHYSAPSRALPYITGVLLLAYLGQTVGAELFDAQISGFFGALAMTPVVLWLDATNRGPPSLVTFLPAFWLLVPGAGGLAGVTEIVGSERQLGLETLVAALVTIMSIALGVLIGTATYRAIASSVQAVSSTVRVPGWLDVPVPRGHVPRDRPR